MALKYPDELKHNNPDYAAVDSDFVRGGGRVVADLTALYALSAKLDQLKQRVTKVYVTSESQSYVLKDIANVGNSTGWEIEASGGGTPGANAPQVQIQYSVDGSTSWHTTPVVADVFARFSVDNGSTWGSPIRYQGAKGDTGATGSAGAQGIQGIQGATGATGASGAQGIQGIQGATGAAGNNAPQVQIQYSVDGSTSWHTTPVVADVFARFSVDNGSTWGSAIRYQGAKGDTGTTGSAGAQGIQGVAGATGAAGTNAPQVQIQYSVDGSTSWHTTPVVADVFARFSVDNGSTWGSAIRYQGAKGDTGATGAAGKGIANTSYNASTGIVTFVFTDSTNYNTTDIRGATGAQGATGATGAQGATGAAGAQGIQGIQGTTGATGAAGTNAPQVQIQYSVDGSTSWHTSPVVADVFARFSVDNGSTWGSSIRYQGAKGDTGATGDAGSQGIQGVAGSTGAAGTNAPSVQAKYSTNGTSGWHTPATVDDTFVRFSVDGGSTWGTALRYQAVLDTLIEASADTVIVPNFIAATYRTTNSGTGSVSISSFLNLPDVSTIRCVQIINNRASMLAVTFRTTSFTATINSVVWTFFPRQMSTSTLNIPASKLAEISYKFDITDSVNHYIEYSTLFAIQP